MKQGRRIDFGRVASAALPYADTIVSRWLPGGRREGPEYVVRNPRRADSRPGSFKVNLRTGRWGDFATGEGGGDLVSLAAFLSGLKMNEAAERVAEMVGVSAYE